MTLPSHRSVSLALGVALFAIVSCDDDGGGGDPCDAYSDDCTQPGVTRCATAAAVQTCERNEEGCLLWTRTESCSERQDCGPAAGGFACLCNDACHVEGPVACDGDTILSCAAGEDGCMIFQPTTDCSEEDLVCSDSSGTAECAVYCVDRCETVGDTECLGNTIVSCFVGPHGCTSFRMETDCSAESQVCDDSTGEGLCVDP